MDSPAGRASPAQRTVQDEVERALCVLLRAQPGRARPSPAAPTPASMRWGRWPATTGRRFRSAALNALLPDDIAVLECVEARAGVRARASTPPAGRTATACWPGAARSALRARAGAAGLAARPRRCCDACAAALVGTHDFTAFTPTETDHVRFERDVFAALWRRPTADGLARVLDRGRRVHAAHEPGARRARCSRSPAGGGRSSRSWRCSTGAPRSAAGPTAPAHGLYLAGVGYGGGRVLGRA